MPTIDNPNTLGGNPTTAKSYTTDGGGAITVDLRRVSIGSIRWFWTRATVNKATNSTFDPFLTINNSDVGFGWASSGAMNNKPGSVYTSKAIGFDMNTSNPPTTFSGKYGFSRTSNVDTPNSTTFSGLKP